MHKGGVGYHPHLEGRSSNGVINFFLSCSFVFSESWLHAGFGLGQSDSVPSARIYSAMLPWSCSGLGNTDPVSRPSPALSVCNRDAFQ